MNWKFYVINKNSKKKYIEKKTINSKIKKFESLFLINDVLFIILIENFFLKLKKVMKEKFHFLPKKT
jgi:hypothetical protein